MTLHPSLVLLLLLLFPRLFPLLLLQTQLFLFPAHIQTAHTGSATPFCIQLGLFLAHRRIYARAARLCRLFSGSFSSTSLTSTAPTKTLTTTLTRRLLLSRLSRWFALSLCFALSRCFALSPWFAPATPVLLECELSRAWLSSCEKLIHDVFIRLEGCGATQLGVILLKLPNLVVAVFLHKPSKLPVEQPRLCGAIIVGPPAASYTLVILPLFFLVATPQSG
mmetsp:Transcript_3195/g.5375  ORF Transcript_3195/g.5375 Transcript_3195/m.5375 type:complete len:222 (+) Transcript_3195:166-831(+)